MKRNEFKLLLEDWKKNFIVESGLSPSNDELKYDLEGYFDDGSFEESGLDDLRHPSHMHSPDDEFLDDSDMDSLDHGGHSLPSFDTHSQMSYGQYPEDEEFASAEFDHDYSSMGDMGDDDLLEIDEMGDEEDGF